MHSKLWKFYSFIHAHIATLDHSSIPVPLGQLLVAIMLTSADGQAIP